MSKRQAFAHESEIRALIWPSHGSEALVSADVDENTQVINVPWAAEEFLERIYVSPYAEEWYRDVVTAILDNFAPALKDRLAWSRMRGVPLY